MAAIQVGDVIQLSAGILACVGAVSGATAFVMRSLMNTRQERLEYELNALKQKHETLEERHRQLLESGNLILNMKSAIDRELELMADRVAASAGSVFVPAPTLVDEDPHELVFLSVIGAAAKSLKRQRIPISESDAGRVFSSGKPQLTMIDGEAAARSFSNKTDKAANYHTHSKATIPLTCAGAVVGVAQFLNKDGGAQQFTHEDLLTLVNNRSVLANRVAELARDPDNLRKVGITPNAPLQVASILFCDITGSSMLMKSLGAAHTTDLLNDYFESLGSIAFEHGGNIDQYFGDGFMVSFNAKRPVKDHEKAAVDAAIEMQRSFDNLKTQWVAMGYCQPKAVYSRIGICAGVISKAELGHSQYKQLTVMGDAVNAASKLCDGAARDRSIIIVSESVKQMLPASMATQEDGGAFRVLADAAA